MKLLTRKKLSIQIKMRIIVTHGDLLVKNFLDGKNVLYLVWGVVYKMYTFIKTHLFFHISFTPFTDINFTSIVLKYVILCCVYEEGKGHPLQYSCLEHLIGRGAWRATVYGVAQLDMTKHTHVDVSREDFARFGM